MIHRVLKSQRSKMSVIYVIMKTMCPPGYHHKGFVATHALGHMMYGTVNRNIYISFGCSSKELEKLLNAKKIRNRMINTKRVRLKNDPPTLMKN